MSMLLISLAAISVPHTIFGAGAEKVHPAGVAGSFYPAEPAALTAMMDTMMSQARVPPGNGPLMALIVPHAGYPYSGPVAAYGYAALKGRKFARVVVIAPSHYDAFDFNSAYDGDAYATPLGTIPVDKEFVAELAKASSSVKLSGRGHNPANQKAEHALEVQLPWLQHTLGAFKLVPIIMGDQSYESSRALGVSLAKLIQRDFDSGETLIVASSDLSHFHTYEDAEKIDHKTLSALQSWDYFTMSRNFGRRVWEACGGGPVVAAMIAADRLGANQGQVLRYANSGDVTGDRSRVVGYGAAALIRSQEQHAAAPELALNDEQKRTLLALAKTSVEHATREQKLYEPPAVADSILNQESGAFVTLREAGQLRGCIGYTAAAKPLYLTVRDTATLAAFRDPRFPPVAVAELPSLEYEISVLSPLRRVLDEWQIQVGRHGLLIKNGSHEGLLLPQVAREHHWDATKFLEQTCVKAGLPADCWKSEDTDVFAFTAIIFEETRSAISR